MRDSTGLFRSKKRDVQIHSAVTIMPNVNSVGMIGEKDTEIAQFAVQLDAKLAPFTRVQVEAAFRGLHERCLERMRAAGLLRGGE